MNAIKCEVPYKYIREMASGNKESELESKKEDIPAAVDLDITDELATMALRTLGERAELDRPLTPHLFRHTLATHLLQRGTPITEVQKILGHVNINTTTIYAKVADEDVKASHMKYAI